MYQYAWKPDKLTHTQERGEQILRGWWRRIEKQCGTVSLLRNLGDIPRHPKTRSTRDIVGLLSAESRAMGRDPVRDKINISQPLGLSVDSRRMFLRPRQEQ